MKPNCSSCMCWVCVRQTNNTALLSTSEHIKKVMFATHYNRPSGTTRPSKIGEKNGGTRKKMW
jgi:hypothetical protein